MAAIRVSVRNKTHRYQRMQGPVHTHGLPEMDALAPEVLGTGNLKGVVGVGVGGQGACSFVPLGVYVADGSASPGSKV